MSDTIEPDITLEVLLAKLVVERGESWMRAVLVRETWTRPTQEEIDACIAERACDEISFDVPGPCGPYISVADYGYWISCWAWVDKPCCEDCGEPLAANNQCQNGACELHQKAQPPW